MNAAHYDRIITGCIMYTKEKKMRIRSKSNLECNRKLNTVDET